MDNNSVDDSIVNENIVEKPLSPVLNRKRFNRKLFLAQKSSKKQTPEPTDNESKLTKSPDKRASSIPIPIKENSHSTRTSPKKGVNCSKDMKPSFEAAAGKSYSTSEGKIREYTNLFFDKHNANVKIDSISHLNHFQRDIKVLTESEPKIKHFKRDKRYGAHQPKIIHHNFEYKHASGDISDESCEVDIRERAQFINGDNALFNKLNMLYENAEFITTHCSKTTLTDSLDSGEVLLIPNCPKLSESVIQGVSIPKEVNKSQLNYNVGTDESNSTLEREIKELDKALEMVVKADSKNDYVIGTQETNMLFSNVSQLLGTELQEKNVALNSSKNTVNVNLTESIFNTLTGISPVRIESREKDLEDKFDKFNGFDIEDIRKAEAKYAKYRTVFMMLNSEVNDAREKNRKKVKKDQSVTHDTCAKHINATSQVNDSIAFSSSCINEFESDIFTQVPVIQKNMKRHYLNEIARDVHKFNEDTNRKSRKNNPDDTDSLANNSIKKKIKKNNAQELGSSSMNYEIETCPKYSNNLVDDIYSHSSTKSQESEEKKSNLGNHLVHSNEKTKKEDNVSNSKSNRKTLSEQTDKSLLKKGCSKKVRNSTEASSSVKISENPNLISLPSNNRVQICIGNNRIKINIRAEGDKNKNEGDSKIIEAITSNTSRLNNHENSKAIVHSQGRCKHIEKHQEQNEEKHVAADNSSISEKPNSPSKSVREEIQNIALKTEEQMSSSNHSQNKESFKILGYSRSGKQTTICNTEKRINMEKVDEALTEGASKKIINVNSVNNQLNDGSKTRELNVKNTANMLEQATEVKQGFEFKTPTKISDYGKTQLNCCGFTTASGKSIKISKALLQNMTKMFEETCFDNNNLEAKETNIGKKFKENAIPLIPSSCKTNNFSSSATINKPQPRLSSKLTENKRVNTPQLSRGNTVAYTETKMSNSVATMNRIQPQLSSKCTENTSSNIPSSSKENNCEYTDSAQSASNSSPHILTQHSNSGLQSSPTASPTNQNPLQRKVLKPKSLLKARPECGRPSYLQSGSRKSLHFNNSTPLSSGDAGINTTEFSNPGFTLASGKNINISKEKLEKAMNLFSDIENISSIKNSNKGKENIPQNCNNDAVFSFATGNKVGLHEDKHDVLGDQAELIEEFGFALVDGTEKFKKPMETFGDLVVPSGKQHVGFSLASGKTVEISKKQLEKGVKFFGDIGNDFSDLDRFGLAPNLEKNVGTPKEQLKRPVEIFGDELNIQDELNGNKPTGFSLASGKKVDISKDKIALAMNMFKDIDKDLEKIENSFQPENISLANGKHVDSTKAIKGESNVQFQEEFSHPHCTAHNNKFSPLAIKENEESLASGKKRNVSPKEGFSLACEKNVVPPRDTLKEAKCIFDNIEQDQNKKPVDQMNRSVPEMLQDAVTAYTSAIEKFSSPKMQYSKSKPDIKPYPVKKQLGMVGRNKQINISKEGLERGKEIFKDLDFNLGNTSFSTPIKKNPANTPQCSTPNLKTNMSTPNSKSFQTLETFNLTPIKPAKLMSKLEPDYKDSTIIFHEKSCSDFKQLQSDINNEYENLKKKLAVLEERKSELAQQKALIDTGASDHRRPKIGVLLESKNKIEERVPLKNLFNSGDESVDYFNVPQHIFDITSKNAEDVHFNIASENDCVSVVKTSDGAIIIPSSGNTVGVTEINNAFQAMKGVDPKLLPIGWVYNHYKWIVWKLASYERKFPQYFKDCLSLENIMQQLKYRYDIEIDRAKRPALRRIYEKDDIPQKRMVLCVSDIIQLYSNKFELELSDGWYSIRTVIDAPLCQQIYRNKIKVGTKLFIQGAELLNCEQGTHPLDAGDIVRLKINYNGTRRAHWYTKLGYYKYAAPFPVYMSSLNCAGGPVGFIKIYIARAYPVRFIENINNIKIWRNAKAEEKRASEFEAERMKQIELIKDEAYKEYQKEKRNTPYKIDENSLSKTELSSISCPKTLYNLIQSSGDPESLIELLTQTQQRAVMEYKQNLNAQRQHEISMRVSKQIEELKVSSRNVVPVLKLVVMDACENLNKYYVFNIWRPSEDHLQMLKEDASFCVYNITFGKMGELHSSKRTYFRQNNETLRLKKPERQLLPIAMTVDNYYKPIFDEFDTVGLIVQISIQEHQQELWVTDFNGRLLYIKIANGPTICCLLDNLKRGITVAITNLIKKIGKNDFGVSIANQCTVISQYPSQKYMQKGLNMFNDQLPKDINKLLSECDNKIDHFKKEVDFMNFSFVQNSSFYKDKSKMNNVTDDSMEDNSTIPSRLTMTDVAMSLIDTDQFT